jgi:CHRD domain
LTYSGLSANVSQSHIHFGRIHTPGGIMVFLCTNLNNGPAGTPTCPTVAGTVTGTITPASVRAIPGQNVSAGDFDAVTDALFADAAYGNIHTVNFPAGEIRAEIRKASREESRDDLGEK